MTDQIDPGAVFDLELPLERAAEDGLTGPELLPVRLMRACAETLPVDGAGPVVGGAHAIAPRRDDTAEWRADLTWLADQCAADSVIMAGDFNATVDNMGRLGVDGGTLGRCHDAAVATGNGAVGTWSAAYPSLLGTPIDHVMATDAWRATGSVVLRSLDGAGGDHRPLVVQLEPAG